MRPSLLKLPLILAAASALLIGVSTIAFADNTGTSSADLTGLTESILSAADNDLSTAVNDVLAADTEALNVTLADLNNSLDPATVQTIPCGIFIDGVGSSVLTQGHFVVTPSGNAVLVCHGQTPVGKETVLAGVVQYPGHLGHPGRQASRRGGTRPAHRI